MNGWILKAGGQVWLAVWMIGWVGGPEWAEMDGLIDGKMYE